MKTKTVFYFLILFTVMIFILELGLYLNKKKELNYSKIYIESAKRETFKGSWNLRYKSHPYFGFVCDKELLRENCNNVDVQSSKNFPIENKKNKLVVGVFGGSVAQSVGHRLEFDGDKWAKLVNTKKTVEFINFATGGYRQPQIYFQLAYYLDIIDIAIVIDGANDAGIGPYPAYPFDYPKLMFRLFESPYKGFLNKFLIKITRSSFSNYSNFLSSSRLFSQSSLAYFSWKAFRNYAGKLVYSLSEELYRNRMKVDSKINLLTEKDLAIGLSNNWLKYVQLSLDLNSEQKKIFHFLQPIPYIEGSKNFSEEELSLLRPEKYKGRYIDTYSKFREGSRVIASKGGGSKDLTMIFRDVDKAVYIDDYCHLNKFGEGILIDTIMNEIKER